MTFLGSIFVLVGCAATAFVGGLFAVHFSVPRESRSSLWHTFWQAVVLGERHRLGDPRALSRSAQGEPSQMQGLVPPL